MESAEIHQHTERPEGKEDDSERIGIVMRWYYLALLIYIAEIIMFASVVLIPLVMYLRDAEDWWKSPFTEARWNKDYD